MNFELSDEQKMVADAIAAIMARFDDAYWLEKDRAGGFPQDFYDEIVRTGFLGIALPEDLGGVGLPLLDTLLVIQTLHACHPMCGGLAHRTSTGACGVPGTAPADERNTPPRSGTSANTQPPPMAYTATNTIRMRLGAPACPRTTFAARAHARAR